MKTSNFKRAICIVLTLVMLISALGITSAFAAEKRQVYIVAYPRSGDANPNGWGFSDLSFMNGWSIPKDKFFSLRTVGSYDGPIAYCIEPGNSQRTGDSLVKKDENFWKNYPSSYNKTIKPEEVKSFIGRIMHYGYTGKLSLEWNTKNAGDKDKLANAIATQILVWETVVGERSSNFQKVSTGGKNAVIEMIKSNPIKSTIMSHYNSIVTKVQNHTKIPSFMVNAAGKAQTVELDWNGKTYTKTLTDTNGVLADFTFTANNKGVHFSVSGNKLTITSSSPLDSSVTITANKKNSNRRGIVVWSDGKVQPKNGIQDLVTYGEVVSDPVSAYLKADVSYGGVKIVKTSEDGNVSGIKFNINGNGINKDVTTDSNGVINIPNLTPGSYTITEYEPENYNDQKAQTVTVVNGKTSTVNFNNTVKRSSIEVIKSSEDKFVSGVKFHLTGKSATGLTVDEYAITDSKGIAKFKSVPLGKNYTLSEVGADDYYAVPENQSAAVEWNKVTKNTFNNTLKKGSLEVTKTSEDGLIEGVKFNLKGITDSGKTIDEIAVTDKNGKAVFANIPIGKNYTLSEVGTDDYYVIPEDQSASIEWNKVTKKSFNNTLKKGSLEIIKTSEDGLVEGIKFNLKGTSESGEKIDKTVVTDKSGKAVFKDMLIGSYTVTEVGAGDYYEVPSSQNAVIEWNTVTQKNFNNTLKRGELKVTKTSEDGFVEGVKFRLTGTSQSGAKVDEIAVTDKNGVAVFKDVLIGSGYVLSEVDTDIKYVLTDDQTTDIKWDEVTNNAFQNILKKFTVTVKKEDSETVKPQGDASLEGAVYGMYKGDKLVDRYTTDKNGSIKTKEYVCGNDWTLKEIEPSEGYLLDKTEHHIGAEAKNYTLEHNSINKRVVENVIKGDIAIIKHTDDGSTQIETPEEGAEFEVYLKAAGSFKNAKESERDKLVCDKNGYAQTKELPFGVYTVHQTKGWDGRDLIDDFDVSISNDKETYHFIINNANFESFIKVVKKDAETGKTVAYAGAGFKIYDPNGNPVKMTYAYPEPTVIDTFYTNEKGYLITPEQLPYGKGYKLVEVQAPYGYVLNSKPISFDVTESGTSDHGDFKVIEVECLNKAQKGTITIEKRGEVFSTVVKTGDIYQPVYEEKALEGAVFNIVAAEDIVTGDGTVRYKKGEVVDTITTGDNGKATTKPLYLGKYSIVEVEAPYGTVINKNVKDVSLVYGDQKIEVVELLDSVTNERQKAEISLKKSMETSDKFGITGDLTKVSFGLFASENIKAADGKVIPKDALIETAFCDKDGNIKFKTDLPVGSKVYVKELTTDDEYVVSNEKFEVTFDYAGQDKAVVKIHVGNGEKIKNEIIYGSIEGTKVTENGKPLGGAVLGLFKADETEFTKDNAIMVTVSADDGSFSFKDVPYGEYVIREIEAPNGFILNNESYKVVINKDKQVVKIEIVNKFVRGNVTLTKVDEDYPENKLTGAEFEIYEDTNGNGKFDEGDKLIGNLVETEKGIYTMTDLPFGKYFVRETKAPEGFMLDTGVYEVVIDKDGMTYEVENKAGIGFINKAMTGTLKIVKTSSDGKVEGFSFKVTGPNGYEEIFVTDKNGEIIIEGLRIGEYTVSEVKNEASEKYIIPADKMAGVQAGSTTIVKMHNSIEEVPVPEIPEVPNTGENSKTGIWVLLGAGALGAVGCGLYFKKKKDSKEKKTDEDKKN